MTMSQIVPTTASNAMSLITGSAMSMTSLEIAELVESRHDNVRVAIQRLAEKGVITLPAMQEKPTSGRPTQAYVFSGERGKRDSIIVVAQLSPEFTARLVDRWQELERRHSGPSLPNFSNPAEAARAWADEVEAKQTALVQLEAARPAVQFVDKYVDSTGLKSFREVCKILHANESRFREFLADRRIMYRLNGAWTAYQNHIDAGRLLVKTGVSQHNGHAFTDVKFTPKGVNWIAGEWAKYQIQIEVV